jgi:hypothetical protein
MAEHGERKTGEGYTASFGTFQIMVYKYPRCYDTAQKVGWEPRWGGRIDVLRPFIGDVRQGACVLCELLFEQMPEVWTYLLAVGWNGGQIAAVLHGARRVSVHGRTSVSELSGSGVVISEPWMEAVAWWRGGRKSGELKLEGIKHCRVAGEKMVLGRARRIADTETGGGGGCELVVAEAAAAWIEWMMEAAAWAGAGRGKSRGAAAEGYAEGYAEG